LRLGHGYQSQDRGKRERTLHTSSLAAEKVLILLAPIDGSLNPRVYRKIKVVWT
jgi:hypothetical protein